MKKICLISSSGGHFEQLSMLNSLSDLNQIYYVTERTKYKLMESKESKIYFLKQINRNEPLFLFKYINCIFKSLLIFLKEKPDVVISTGALCVIPTFLIGKCFGSKLIFIESFAKIDTPTLTGKFLYKISDIFIVQWESMLKVYPKAIYLGSIY